MPNGNGYRDPHTWIVALVLAIGASTAIGFICFGAVYTAVTGTSDVNGGISDNATTLLTTTIGGIIGVLGSYVGGRAVERAWQERTDIAARAGREEAAQSVAATVTEQQPRAERGEDSKADQHTDE